MFEILRVHIEKKVPLTNDEFAQTSAFFTVRKLRKKQFLLQQGDVCRYESFVVSGCLKSYHSDDQGVDHVLRFSVEDHWSGDRLHDLELANRILTEEVGDLLAIGRYAIANPDLPKKIFWNEPLLPFESGMIKPSVSLANRRNWIGTRI